MNRTLTDPHLRTFRLPLVVRLRTRIDDLRDVIESQAKYRIEQDRRIRELERELSRAARELAAALKVIDLTRNAEGVISDSASND